jgi:hypothetical protein
MVELLKEKLRMLGVFRIGAKRLDQVPVLIDAQEGSRRGLVLPDEPIVLCLQIPDCLLDPPPPLGDRVLARRADVQENLRVPSGLESP